MKTRFSLLPVILTVLLILITSCSTAPEEAEVKAKIVGEYCADGYKLSLGEDMEYRNTKFHIGATSGKLFTEYCKGTYSLVMEESQELSEKKWFLVFEKDPGASRTTIFDCNKTVAVWSS